MQHQTQLTQQDFTALIDGQPYLFLTQSKVGYRKGDFIIFTLKDTRSQITCEVMKAETEHVNGKWVFVFVNEHSRDIEAPPTVFDKPALSGAMLVQGTPGAGNVMTDKDI